MKNTDFKYLYEQLKNILETSDMFDIEVQRIIVDELQPQYKEAFTKYQNEKQEFNKNESVLFRHCRRGDWQKGMVSKIQQLANRQYKYTISYLEKVNYYDDEIEEEVDTVKTRLTNPLTKKNIKKA